MDLTDFQEFREYESENCPIHRINRKIEEGWRLISIRTERTPAQKDGAFREKHIYLLGRLPQSNSDANFAHPAIEV